LNKQPGQLILNLKPQQLEFSQKEGTGQLIKEIIAETGHQKSQETLF